MAKDINKTMKIVLMLCAIILVIAISGCTEYIEVPIVETVTETITETVIETEYVEVINNDEILRLQEELNSYKGLIDNLNELLGFVYYGWAESDNYIIDGFTAFSIEYGGSHYIVTAGHAVERNGERFYNHRFKANFSDEWIYPELLYYLNGNLNNDYAIFKSDKIEEGFKVCKEPSLTDTNKYVLGSYGVGINTIKHNIYSDMLAGESGSPVINMSGEVIGVIYGNGEYTWIDVILDRIDNL